MSSYHRACRSSGDVCGREEGKKEGRDGGREEGRKGGRNNSVKGHLLKEAFLSNPI